MQGSRDVRVETFSRRLRCLTLVEAAGSWFGVVSHFYARTRLIIINGDLTGVMYWDSCT